MNSCILEALTKRRVPGLSGSARERSFGGRALTRDDNILYYDIYYDMINTVFRKL